MAVPGDYYLLRYQDRFVWVQLLERGIDYCRIAFKGPLLVLLLCFPHPCAYRCDPTSMCTSPSTDVQPPSPHPPPTIDSYSPPAGLELQATSCHTAEASRVDEAFEAAFERASGKRCGGNSHYSLCLTPADSTYIQNYSSARSTLTGIIDSPSTLKSVSAHLLWTLIWVVQQRVADRTAGPLPAGWRSRHVQQAGKSAPFTFPIDWYKSVVERFGEEQSFAKQHASPLSTSGGGGGGGVKEGRAAAPTSPGPTSSSKAALAPPSKSAATTSTPCR